MEASFGCQCELSGNRAAAVGEVGSWDGGLRPGPSRGPKWGPRGDAHPLLKKLFWGGGSRSAKDVN